MKRAIRVLTLTARVMAALVVVALFVAGVAFLCMGEWKGLLLIAWVVVLGLEATDGPNPE
jgi:hypothetical protein